MAILFSFATAGVSLCLKADLILIDFGSPSYTTDSTDVLSRTWNNVATSSDTEASPLALVDSNGDATLFTISSDGKVTSWNQSGTQSPTGSASALNFPVSATRDSLFVQGNGTENLFTLSNLDSGYHYAFTFFASRIGAGENRESEYAIAGGNKSESVFLNPSENTGAVTSATGFTPNGSNKITITLSEGPNNVNSSSYAYIGAMQIEITAIPEPSTVSLFILTVGAGIVVWRKKHKTLG